jgi:RNA polymerase sigma-70 factor (ECF subfamily)
MVSTRTGSLLGPEGVVNWSARMRETDDTCSAERLMQLVRDGEPSALDHITRCYGDRLLAAGRRHCRSGAEADDAVQDALVTAATHLDQFRGTGSLEGWLVRIVARACRHLGRGQKNDESRHDRDPELPAQSSSPEQQAAQRELALLLERTLLELNSQDRAIVLLAELSRCATPSFPSTASRSTSRSATGT